MIGCCQTWSATPMRSKPASSAARPMFARVLPKRSDPPFQSKLLSCNPSFTKRYLHHLQRSRLRRAPWWLGAFPCDVVGRQEAYGTPVEFVVFQRIRPQPYIVQKRVV